MPVWSPWSSRPELGHRFARQLSHQIVDDHPDLIAAMTGTGVDRYELARNMSDAWVAFARSGNPNHRGIPRWNPWNPTGWPTMVFNREIAAMNDPWGDERRALEAIRSREAGVGRRESGGGKRGSGLIPAS